MDGGGAIAPVQGVSLEDWGMRVSVVIASAGRPEFIEPLLLRLHRQTMKPCRVVVVTPSRDDNPLIDQPADPAAPFLVEHLLSARGLPRQRNVGLERVLDDCDAVVFFDDDYVPSKRAIEGIIAAFQAFPDVAGISGDLLADGIHGPGIPLDDAVQQVDAYDAAHTPKAPEVTRQLSGLYGCNMAIRTERIDENRFDERLPLYAWQEDADFAGRIPGRKVRVDSFVGVHCGAKRGRERSGRMLGYSQIINPAYLVRKGSMSLGFALRLSLKNIFANHLKVLAPEPWIDRRGRMTGNWLGIADLLRGRREPERVLEFK
ncbi:MAG: glycosyltransferase [Pseudomonadota bacterium]